MGARHDAFSSKRNRKHAADLLMMERLPVLEWPRDLYAAAQPMQQQAKPPLRIADSCSWDGCKSPHYNNVSMTIRSFNGTGWHTRWYCCDGCKSLYVKKYGRT